jgi:putative hydrolase of the HAD superfamily
MEWQRIRGVFFDAVGTLIHPEPPAALVYAQVGRYFGSNLACDTILRRFATAFAREEKIDQLTSFRTSEQREEQRWRNIVGAVLDDVNDREKCFQELYRHFSMPGAWRVDPEGAAVAAELAIRGYLVGLASNYDRRLRNVVAGRPELRDVSCLIISSEVGWRKPAPAFFAALCAAAGQAPGDILFIGDDLGNDYDGARAAGLQAVVYDPADQYGPEVERIRSFGELVGEGKNSC